MILNILLYPPKPKALKRIFILSQLMKYALLGLALSASLIPSSSEALLMESGNGLTVIPANGCYGTTEWKGVTTADSYTLSKDDIQNANGTAQGILEVVVGRIFETGRVDPNVNTRDLRDSILTQNPDIYDRKFQSGSRVTYESTKWAGFCIPDGNN